MMKETVRQLVGLAIAVHAFHSPEDPNRGIIHGNLEPVSILCFSGTGFFGTLKIGGWESSPLDPNESTSPLHGHPLQGRPDWGISFTHDMLSMACIILEVLTWLLQDMGVLDGVEAPDELLLKSYPTWKTGCIFWHDRPRIFAVKNWAKTLSRDLVLEPASALSRLLRAVDHYVLGSIHLIFLASDPLRRLEPSLFDGERDFIRDLRLIFSANTVSDSGYWV